MVLVTKYLVYFRCMPNGITNDLNTSGFTIGSDHRIYCTNCVAFQNDKGAVNNYFKAISITQNISGQSRSKVTLLLGIEQ